jgi:AraC-like DNA-binding protein
MEPLSHFPFVMTHDPAELEMLARKSFQIRSFDLPDGAEGFVARCNHLALDSLSVTYCHYGARLRMSFPAADFVRVQLGLKGRARSRVDRREVQLTPMAVCITPENSHFEADGSGEFEQLILRLDAAALARLVQSLTGRHVPGPLAFDVAPSPDTPGMRHFARTMNFFMDEMNATQAALPRVIRQELSQNLLLSFLYSHPHDLSRYLFADESPIAPWQVRIIEDYIEAHWSEALSVDKLAKIAGASARSIFASFRKARGHGPMQHLKRVRLSKAREMLQRGNSKTSVTGVAFACHFHNPGHFARDFREAFGELPSETLRRAKHLS